ncbi:DEAD/DEAH box helicase, partial [bacterium]|nr:DEAD/DEAH box helicase [bacterium]
MYVNSLSIQNQIINSQRDINHCSTEFSDCNRNNSNAFIHLSELLGRQDSWQKVINSIQHKPLTVCTSLVQPVRSLFIYELHKVLDKKPPILWVTASMDSAERLIQDSLTFFAQFQLLLFPEKEHAKLLGENCKAEPERLSILQAIDEYKNFTDDQQLIIVTPIRALLQPTIQIEKLEREKLVIRNGESVDLELLQDILESQNYERRSMIEHQGEYSIRGGIIDIYPITGLPVRFELYDDTIESLRTFDIDTQRSTRNLEEFLLMPNRDEEVSSGQNEIWLSDHLCAKAPQSLVVLDEPNQIKLAIQEYYQEWDDKSLIPNGMSVQESNFLQEEVDRRLQPFKKIIISADKNIESLHNTESIDLATEIAKPFTDKINDMLEILPQWQKENRRIILLSSQASRLEEILREEKFKNFSTESYGLLKAGHILILQGYIDTGWRLKLDDGYLELISDREIVGQHQRRHKGKVAVPVHQGSKLRLEELSPGDYVVHIQHGISLYKGVESVKIDGIAHDLLRLEFAKGDCILLPIDQMHLIQKYESLEDFAPRLTKLGGSDWKKTKAKIKAFTEDIAQKLIDIEASRTLNEGVSCGEDSQWQKDMENAFAYTETPDQMKAICEVKDDLESSQAMERLICGDVGYGKTEVALRAAFKMVDNGFQVAVLAPTTVLAHQHYLTFSERFGTYPIKIRLLSRARSAKEQKEYVEEINSGSCDIVIGTHRILSKDVNFKKLGLLIIDEEHRFGVKDKEKIKELQNGVNILTMSATPIPR